MTEAEFSTLLSHLSTTAQQLNRESDSINEIIGRFQDTLRKLNVGIEVWVAESPLSRQSRRSPSHTDTYEDREYQIYMETETCQELGFAKVGQDWSLVVRESSYEREEQSYHWQDEADWRLFSRTDPRQRLLEAPRALRLKALQVFPDLLKELTDEAAAALKTIHEAKKFVQ